MKKVIALLIIVLQPSLVGAVWVSPIAHDTANEDHWFRCEMAYDNLDHTFAYERVASARQPLDLIFSPAVTTDMWFVSLWGEYGTIDSFELWLFYDEDWHLSWDGSAFGPLIQSLGGYADVSKARILSEFDDHALCVIDVKLNHVPEPATILLLILGSLLLRKH